MSTATQEPIVLTRDYPKQTMARSVPGAFWDSDEKAWVLRVEDITPRAAAVVLKLFPDLAVPHPELEEIRDRAIQDVRPFDNATPFCHYVSLSAPNVADALSPNHELIGSADAPSVVVGDGEQWWYQFQNLDLGYMVAVLKEHGGAYIGWERGLGKTLGAYTIADALKAENVIVVAPNTAKTTVWLPEARRFWPHEAIVLPNQKTKRERTMRRVLDMRQQGVPVLLIVHYEALAIIGGKDGRGWNKYGPWDLVVADEAHRIKNPKAKMTRALKKVPTKYKLALSGSIIQNHADELFSPLQWLFPERYRSKWRDWNDRFLDYVDGGFSRVFVGIKLERLEELREELGVFMVYRRKEDELDLPPRTEENIYVELSSAQRKAYEELVSSCLAELEDGTKIKAQDGLPMLGALRQVATGLDLVSGEMEDSTKLDLAFEMIEDNEDEAFVVFSWYKAAAHAMAARLEAKGIESFVVTGDVKQDKRAEMIARFQEGEGRVFIGTLSTLGESVNLFRANNAIFLDRSWNPATNVQAADRIYRIGQDKPVTVTHIIAKDTVDEHRVLPTITNKEALRRLILGG
jgi:SNF2 family DNA or RNA helicase